MNWSNIDSKLQCEWAKTLAASGAVSLEDVQHLTRAALPPRGAGLKTSRSSRSPQNKTVEEIRLCCVLPLCSFLEESHGQHADYLVPQILNQIVTLPEVFNLQPESVGDFQKAVTRVLLKLKAVMQLKGLPGKYVEQISQAMHDVIKKCVDPEGKVSSGPTSRYFFVRALARDPELEENLPMLPHHASALLQWLHDHFYTQEADAYAVTHISVDLSSKGMNTKAVIDHLDDEKIMAMTIPIVCAAFPVKALTKNDVIEAAQSASSMPLSSLCRIVAFACESVQSALKPILESGPDRKLRLDMGPGMSFSNRQKAPSSDLVRAAAKLATSLVYRLWECQKKGTYTPQGDFSLVKDEVLKVVDIMLEVAETCLSAAWDSGAVYALASAKNMLCETMELVPAAVSFGESMSDNLSRLQILMLSCTRLLEAMGETDQSMANAEYSPVRSHSSTSTESTVALEWDVSRSFIDQVSSKQSPTLELCGVAAEALAVSLAEGWKAKQKSDVLEVAIPLGNIMVASAVPGTSGERQIAALALGRLFVLVGGDPDMARLLLPLLMDSMLGSDDSTSAAVYACLLHVLATIGGVSGRCDFPWALDQVLEQMIKLYKDPHGAVSAGLMFATGREGKQKGQIANAFLQVATMMQDSKPSIRKRVRHKLLALFSDFGLRANELNAIYDLGALLPAIAAACEHLDRSLPRMIFSHSSSIQKLTACETPHSDISLIRNFRNLWMYSAIYRFSGISKKGSSYMWPSDWQQALGKIAIATPALSNFEGPQKSDTVRERLQAELQDRLARAGPHADTVSLNSLLKEVVSPFGIGFPVPSATGPGPAVYAYLLAVATLELSRAALSPLPAFHDASPLATVMSYLSVAVVGSLESQWFRAIAEAVFHHNLKRFSDSAFSRPSSSATIPVQYFQQKLALTLIDNLATGSGHVEGDYPQVAELANTLLAELVKAVPSLYWNGDCLNQLLSNLDQEETASVLVEGIDVRNEGLVWNWVWHWVDAIATMAPTRAEAIIHEYLRDDSCPENRVVLRHAAEFLSRCSKAGHKQSQAEKEGTKRFMRSLARKSYYIGRVSGFSDGLDRRSVGTNPEILERVVESLKEAVAPGRFSKDVEKKYLQAAGMLMQCTPSTPPQNLLRAICWTPVQIFTPEMMKLATFSWEWVLTGTSSLNLSMVAEIVDAWIWTIHKRMGIFSGSKYENESNVLYQPDDSAQASSIDGIKAHGIWLSFLLEQWEVSRQAPTDTLAAHAGVFRRLLTHSLHHPHALSHHAAAAGARFKLLTLGLRYCEFFAEKSPGCVPTSVLYERIIRAGLTWFEYPQSWYGQPTRIEGEEEVLAIKTFTGMLAHWPRKSNLGRSQGSQPTVLLAGVWHSNNWNRESSDRRRDLLIHLCKREIERLQVWVCPIPNCDSSAVRTSLDWSNYVQTAWMVHPRLAFGLLGLFPATTPIENELFSLIIKNATDPTVQAIPQAGIILANSDPMKRLKAAVKLELLKHWTPAPVAEALGMMAVDSTKQSTIKGFIIASLCKADPDELAFYLPQLVQGLRHDSDHALEHLLAQKASQSWIFCHRLMWYLRSEFKPPPEAMNPAIKRSGWKAPSDTGLWSITEKLYKSIRDHLSDEQRQFMEGEIDFFDNITAISGMLKPIPTDERRAKIEEELQLIPLTRTDLYIPTNPEYIVRRVICDSGTPMPSKEKMPILVQFDVSKEDEHDEDRASRKKQACIFKVGDDVRQDVLALQIIKILKDAFIKAGLDLYLCPYGVIPTGYEKGIIEVVPNSKSRSALGETTDGGLYEIFQREFGPPGSHRFEAARHNFMVSEAGYAIASYLLQCKDRHNGNILIDSEGHLVHIDFGFILEISPGKNMKFESADFKLSHEMTQLLDPGGMRNSQFYHMFEEMCIRAFLAARSVAEPIISCVALMKHSGLPCFEIGHAVRNIRNRFHLEKSEKQVAAHVRSVVDNAYCKWTTAYYDKLQNYTY